MPLSLVKLAQSRQALHPYHLVDPELLPAPVRRQRSSLYFAWMWDWTMAMAVAAGLTSAWMEFLSPLVFPFISHQSQLNFTGSSDWMVWIVAPLVHFALAYWGVSTTGQTVGLQFFSHRVSDEKNALTWQQSLMWALGSTVSVVGLGIPALKLDELVHTTTMTEQHFHWQFQKELTGPEKTVDLLAQLEEEAPLALPRAA